MPKISAKVLAIKIDEKGQFLAKLVFNGKLPKVGDIVSCKWGKSRSSSQNNLYWVYLTFLWQDCNLKDEYSTIDELHETLKATFLSKRVFRNGMEFIKVGSTTTLDKISFGEYLSKVDKAMCDFFNFSTADFWQQYEDIYKMF